MADKWFAVASKTKVLWERTDHSWKSASPKRNTNQTNKKQSGEVTQQDRQPLWRMCIDTLLQTLMIIVNTMYNGMSAFCH